MNSPVIQMFKPYISEKAIERVVNVLRSGWIGEGEIVQEFENRIRELLGCQYVIAVNSGTSALHLALILAGVKQGDEVITTAQTMLATSQAILVVGAKPVYADIQYENGNLNPKDIRNRITSRTRVILTVDWGGYPCDYEEIISIGKEFNLTVIEDAAHALGAEYKGKKVGSICPYTCFSFQAIKHLTTGDGGLLCVPDEKSYKKAIRLRWFGIDRFNRKPSLFGEPEWNVSELGYKYHMNNIAAAIGLGNLEDLPWILNRRHSIVAKYREAFKNFNGIKLFDRKDDRISADWLFSIHVERREDFCRAMTNRGVSTSVVHFRIDRNQLLGGERTDLPQLDHFTETHISLPLHPLLTDDEVERVIEAVKLGW